MGILIRYRNELHQTVPTRSALVQGAYIRMILRQPSSLVGIPFLWLKLKHIRTDILVFNIGPMLQSVFVCFRGVGTELEGHEVSAMLDILS